MKSKNHRSKPGIWSVVAGTAALAAALAAPPAYAQHPFQFARVGGWQVKATRPGTCAVERAYGSGTVFSVTAGAGGTRLLTVFNRGWDLKAPGTYRISLLSGGERQAIKSLHDDGVGLRGLLMTVGGEVMRRLAGGGTLQVDRPDGSLAERLDLAGLPAALRKLPECMASKEGWADSFPRAATPPPPPGPPILIGSRPARPTLALPNLFSIFDYPAAAIRAGEQGTVGFRVEVSEAGRVTACTITASSGSAILDATTCRLLTLRARISPARDSRGAPIADSFSSRIVWRLEEPPPPPEPVPPPPPSAPREGA